MMPNYWRPPGHSWFAFSLLVLTLAGCDNGRPMSQEDRELAVMLLGKPSYTPSYQVPFYPMQTGGGRSFSCSTISGITNCY
jgi:hypothetical protein